MLYHTDKEGNVTYLLDGSGNAIEHYTYDAFGAATITDMSGNTRAASAYGNDYLFNGKEYVAEMGLYYYRHRWYQPQLGRFLQVDPKGFDTGDENLFRYCMDDPVDKTDPDGMFGIPPEQSITGDQISAADRFDLINLAGETSLQGNLAATALSDYNTGLKAGNNIAAAQVQLQTQNGKPASIPIVHRAKPEVDEHEVDVVKDREGRPLVDAQGNPWRGDTRADVTATEDTGKQNEYTLHLRIETQLAKIGTADERRRTAVLEHTNQGKILDWYNSSGTLNSAFFAALTGGRAGLQGAMQNQLSALIRIRRMQELTGLNSLEN